jgi:dienelactone hydrolase
MSLLRLASILFFGLLLLGARVQAQSPQWGTLGAGAHRVGYRTLHLADSSRRYFEGPRTIQVHVWYPAEPAGVATPMLYEGYFDDAARDWGVEPDRVSMLQRRLRDGFRSGALNPSFPGGLTPAQFDSILRTPTAVYRGATPAAGPFPVLLHAHVNGALHQSIMMEYLASHGYVVLSTSLYNSAPVYYGYGDDTADALYQLSEDFALMLAAARRIPHADVSRAATIGMMAAGGLPFQMKSGALRAIACVECLGYTGQLERQPVYDSIAVRIPILELINSDHEDETTNQEKSFLDRFRASPRYIGRFAGVGHPDFYPFPKIARLGTPHPKHDAVLHTTLQFLNSVLRNDERGRRFLSDNGPLPGMEAGFLRIRTTAAEPIPVESEVLGWIRYGEVARAEEAIRTFGSSVVTRNRLFTVVLFLARDLEPHAARAVALFRASFPATPGTNEARQDEMLTRLLSRRGPGQR